MDPIIVSILTFTFITLLVLGIQQLRQSDDRMVASRVKKLRAEDVKEKIEELNKEPVRERQELWRRALAAASRLSPAVRLGQRVDKKLADADVPLRGEEIGRAHV